MKNNTIPTLYDWAGGKEKLEQLTKLFYERVAKDELIGPIFAGMSPEHAKHVAHFIAEVFGGPKLYTDGDAGSHATMIAKHLGRTLTEDQRKRWLLLLLNTADDIGIPDDPEFRSALLGYLEWGSRLAIINSNATENPVNENEPMPKWGWGETGGPYMP